MKRKVIWRSLVMVLTLLIFNSCLKSETVTDTFCGNDVIVDQELYNKTSISNYTITNVSVSNYCLFIEISSSGCGGSSWITSLVDSEASTFSLPPTRFLRFSLTNTEACQALITKTYAFDLSSVFLESETIVFNLEGWSEPIIIN